jgi:hypothetical protein
VTREELLQAALDAVAGKRTWITGTQHVLAEEVLRLREVHVRECQAAFDRGLDAGHARRHEQQEYIQKTLTELEETKQQLNMALATMGMGKDSPVFREHLRLDGMWQRLVREKDAAEQDLQRFREREPLVQELLEAVEYAKKHAVMLGPLPMSKASVIAAELRDLGPCTKEKP